jgi:hypothetical protein
VTTRPASAFLRSPLLIFAVAGAGVCLGSSGQVSTSPLPLRSLGHVGWTAADFDGDNQLDVATTRSAGLGGYVLELELSSQRAGGSGGHFSFPPLPSSAFGLHLTPRDVDGDHDLDIVITSGFARQPVAVWINDGKGRFEEGDLAAYPAWIWREDLSFSAQNPPQTSPWFFDQNRRPRYDVELGRGSIGPVLPCNKVTTLRPELLVPLSSVNQRSARAPPLSFLS